MDFYRKYELIDALPGEGTKSFRARQVSTARDVTVHLLVGGRTPENEQLLARLRNMPAQSFAKLIEVGDNDGTPYVVTIAPPYQPLAEWLVEQEKIGAQAAGKMTQGGAWKLPNTAPTGASPASQAPAKTAPPRTPTAPPGTPVAAERPLGASDAFRAPPKPAAQPGAAASAPPGEFTLMFQAGQKEQTSPQRPASATDAHSVPGPSSGPADAGPGEFTRMFQTGSQQPPAATSRPSSSSASFPVANAPGAPAEHEPGEFTKLFQAGSKTPAQQPVAPSRPTSTTDSFNAPVSHASPKSAPPPSSPAESEPGEFTRMFQTGSSPAASPSAAPQRSASATDSFHSPVGKSPGAPATPPAAQPEPGEFTKLFQTGTKTPAQQPVDPQRPMSATDSFNVPVAKSTSGPAKPVTPPGAPSEPEPGEFTRLFQTGSSKQPVAPQRPAGATDSFSTPLAKSPASAKSAPDPSEFSKMFADVPNSRMPEPSLAPPPPPSAAPGEFTKMFNSPLPDRPDPKESWGQPPVKLSGAGTFPRMLPAQPASSRSDEPSQGGEFTRFFKTPAGAAPPAQPPAGLDFGAPASSGFGQPNPMSPMNPGASQPKNSPQRGQPGEFTRMFGPREEPAAESFSPAGGRAPNLATGAFSAPPVQPPGYQPANPYGAGAQPGAPAVPPVQAAPPEPQGPSEYTMMIKGGGSGQPGVAPGSPAGVPAAPQSGGGSPLQINVQAPYIPGVQAPRMPQLPYVPQPRVDIAGVRVDGPSIPQPHIPSPHLPQPQIPNASITTKGPSNNTLLIVIFVLVALLIGAALGVFLKK